MLFYLSSLLKPDQTVRRNMHPAQRNDLSSWPPVVGYREFANKVRHQDRHAEKAARVLGENSRTLSKQYARCVVNSTAKNDMTLERLGKHRTLSVVPQLASRALQEFQCVH